MGGEDGIIRLMNLETFSLVRTLKGHIGRISDLDFSPDSRMLLSVGRDGTARLWRVETGLPEGKEALLNIKDAHLYSGRINPFFPNRYIIAGDRKGYLYAKDLKSNKIITKAKLHAGPIHAVAYQPKGNGTYFSAGADGLLNIRFSEGKRVSLKAHDGVIFDAGYDPTGSVAYTAGYDRKIKIWDAKNAFSNKVRHVLEGHLKYVLAASISRSDKLMVSGGGDRAVNVWSVESGKLIAHLEGHMSDIEAVTFTPDNRFIISASEDKSLRIWSLENREELVRMYFRTGADNYAGLTFDNQLFGDQNSGLITVRVDGKEVSPPYGKQHVKYIGREISISSD